MAQLTLYLDQDTADKTRRAAESEGLSQSQWVARLIQRRLTNTWPQAVVELAGAWPDLPEVEALRYELGDDAGRETL